MKSSSRRSFLALAPLLLAPTSSRAEVGKLFGKKEASEAASRHLLPMETIFKGEDRFRSIVKKARNEDWSKLPIGKRIIKCARELHGRPYESFTLEIDDHIESPSVNLNGLDCWTFFEQSLGLARMLGFPKDQYTPQDLLKQIEFTRYRGGYCSGNYLERIHYLAEWFLENDARGTCDYITPDLPGATRFSGRKISEMTTLWKSYRYLRNNPELRAPMKETEDRVAAMPVSYIPKSKVAAIESKLQDGDVIGVATKHNGGFCSHVGLVVRTDDGVARFMHASRNYKKVVIDKSVSGYLNDFSSHSGAIVGRPLEVDQTVTDPAQYRANLKRLLG
jgi:hypothetical protein